VKFFKKLDGREEIISAVANCPPPNKERRRKAMIIFRALDVLFLGDSIFIDTSFLVVFICFLFYSNFGEEAFFLKDKQILE